MNINTNVVEFAVELAEGLTKELAQRDETIVGLEKKLRQLEHNYNAISITFDNFKSKVIAFLDYSSLRRTIEKIQDILNSDSYNEEDILFLMRLAVMLEDLREAIKK
jgi:archaellum component FlaC